MKHWMLTRDRMELITNQLEANYITLFIKNLIKAVEDNKL